jgi:tetratricopeptide (TPR) repeat protein
MRVSRLALMVMLMSTGQLLAQSENNETNRPPGKLREMLDFCNNIISKRPDNPVGYRRRALVLAELGEGYKAAADYTKAIQLVADGQKGNPKDFQELFRERAAVWRSLGEPELAKADFDEAFRLCTEAIKADDKKSPAVFGYLFRADLLSESHSLRRAIEDYTEAIRLGPESAVADQSRALADRLCAAAYQSRALAYESIGDNERALQDFDQSIKLDSQDANVYMNRGSLHLLRRSYDKALADLNAAIALLPTAPKLFLIRSRIFQAQGDSNAALKDAEEAVRLWPNSSMCVMERAERRRALNDLPGSASDKKLALECFPKNPKGFDAAARWMATSEWAEFRDGRVAVDLAEKACEATNSKNVDYLDTLAAAYAEAGQFDKAIEWQQKALDLAAETQQEAFAARLTLYRAGKPYREAQKLDK